MDLILHAFWNKIGQENFCRTAIERASQLLGKNARCTPLTWTFSGLR